MPQFLLAKGRKMMAQTGTECYGGGPSSTTTTTTTKIGAAGDGDDDDKNKRRQIQVGICENNRRRSSSSRISASNSSRYGPSGSSSRRASPAAPPNTVAMTPALLAFCCLLTLFGANSNAELMPTNSVAQRVHRTGGLRLLNIAEVEQRPLLVLEIADSEESDEGRERAPFISYNVAGSPSQAEDDEEDADIADESKEDQEQQQQLMVVPLLPAKRKKSIRRCGTLLLKHIQTVCGGCLRSPTPGAESLMAVKRNGETQLDWRNRIKRQAPGFNKITDICCAQRACDDEEVKPFCC